MIGKRPCSSASEPPQKRPRRSPRLLAAEEAERTRSNHVLNMLQGRKALQPPAPTTPLSISDIGGPPPELASFSPRGSPVKLQEDLASPQPKAPPVPSKMRKQVLALEKGLGGEANTREEDPGDRIDDEQIRSWQKMVDNGVDIRSAAGQRFSRASDGGLTAEYKNASRSEKSEMRKKWAQTQLNNVLIGKEKSQTWKRVDVSKGVYLPFAKIWQEEGGDEAGAEAALNYVQACAAMSGCWKKYNKMTKRLEWLYMRQEVHELFEESWRLYEQHYHDDTDAPIAKKALPPLPAVAPATMLALPPVPDPNAPPPPPTPAPGPKPKTPPKKIDKEPLEIAVAAAQSTKKLFQGVGSKAQIVLDNIQTKDEWAWAKGFYEKKLGIAMKPVTDSSGIGFASTFLTMDIKQARQLHPGSALRNECVNFSQKLNKPLEDLSKLINKLMKLHAEHMKED